MCLYCSYRETFLILWGFASYTRQDSVSDSWELTIVPYIPGATYCIDACVLQWHFLSEALLDSSHCVLIYGCLPTHLSPLPVVCECTQEQADGCIQYHTCWTDDLKAAPFSYWLKLTFTFSKFCLACWHGVHVPDIYWQKQEMLSRVWRHAPPSTVNH